MPLLEKYFVEMRSDCKKAPHFQRWAAPRWRSTPSARAGCPHGGLRVRARAFEWLIEEFLILFAERSPELTQPFLLVGQNHAERQDRFSLTTSRSRGAKTPRITGA